MLFLDARNYYTVVDRTLNEWNHWQLSNLTAIVHLYRGEKDKYSALLSEYLSSAKALYHDMEEGEKALAAYLLPEGKKAAAEALEKQETAVEGAKAISDLYDLMKEGKSWEDLLSHEVQEVLDTVGTLRGKAQREKLDALTAPKTKVRWTAYKKEMNDLLEEEKGRISAFLELLKEAKWLTDKFGDGEYKDIPGLCKAATRAEIKEKNWSLTPGAYVGVAPEEDDGVDFHERMKEIHEELLSLQKESDTLMETISKNFKEMGL